MPHVFTNDQALIAVGPEWLERLTREARTAPLGRARLCLHRSTRDAIQEMVIAFRRDSLVRPHRHPERCESVHVIRGKGVVLIFDDTGKVTRRIDLAALGQARQCEHWMYRLCEGLWHTLVPMSDDLVIHEASQGPFEQSGGGSFAPFAPEDGPALDAFIERTLAESLSLSGETGGHG
ncbi:MAG: WbuC family cupin fold metalloprotein [Phycisphaeraceae bacterium]|nr:WbuC family cupin fold metalloprotein [Phycisphaeraceae bacterium]